jgi:5-methylcytosine-specific restriction endonuclease McrA
MARAGGDKRGSSRDRAVRKRWLLSPDAGFGGNGESVECIFECGTVLTYETVEADRKIPGGSYRRENVQPACRPCNLARSDDGDLTIEEIAARVQKTVERTGRLAPALGMR